MVKQPPRQVPSDDCVVEIDGIESHPHKGESVTLAGWFDMDDLRLMYQFGELLGQISASEDEEALRLVNTSDPLLEKFIGALTPLIVSWSWSDVSGKPLPQPYRNAAAFKALSLGELVYLSLLAVPRLPEGQKATHYVG